MKSIALLLAGLGVFLGTWIYLRPAPAPPPVDPAPDPAALESERGPIGREALGNAELKPTASPGGVPRHLADANREAISALESGDLSRAVELFELCHAGAPGEPVFARNLAEALARLARQEQNDRARRHSALESLERAIELDPAREDLALLLARWRRQGEAEATFWTDESLHFHLSYDGSRTELLHRGQRQMLDVLEDAYQSFGELFGHYPVEAGAAKIQVVVHSREQFGDLTGLGHWAGGVYDGIVRVPLEDLERELPELRRVLRHELVHAFVREVGGRDVPGWLNEGLAQYLEEPFDTDRSARARKARRALQGVELFPLERLQGSLATWQDASEISRAYSQSLALVDHIQRWYGERLLYDMVAGCADSVPPAETFRQRTHLELDSVQQDLAERIESEG